MIDRSTSGAKDEESLPLAQLLAPLLLRLRVRQASEELVSGALCVLAFFAAYALLRSLTGASAVLSAVQPLFFFSGIAILAVFCARAIRKMTLAHAANEADTRANLFDELKTAYWLAARGDLSSLESLQMQRADVTARHLHARKLIPRFPRLKISLLLAFALLGGMLMRLAPGSLGLTPARLTEPLALNTGDALGRGEKSAIDTKVANADETPENASLQASNASTDVEANAQSRDVTTGQEGGSRESTEKQQAEEDTEALSVAKGEHEDTEPPVRGSDPQRPAALSAKANTPLGTSAQSQASASSSSVTGEATLESVFDRLSESARRVADGGGENAVTGAAEAKQKADAGDSNAPVQRNIAKGDGQSSEGAAAAPMSGQLQGEGAQGQGQGVPAEGSADSQHSGQMPEFATLTTTGGFGSPKASPIPGLKGLQPDPGKVPQLKRTEAQPRLVNIEASTGDSGGKTAAG